MGFVRIGTSATPQSVLVDTGAKYSIIPRETIAVTGSHNTGRTGKVNILQRKLHGELHRVKITSLDGRCAGETTAFVPDAGSDWGRGVLLGAEFLQDTKMHVNAKGEAYCPAGTKKR
jgi:predicted aspartyl protease